MIRKKGQSLLMTHAKPLHGDHAEEQNGKSARKNFYDPDTIVSVAAGSIRLVPREMILAWEIT
jgi:hypothetical protein